MRLRKVNPSDIIRPYISAIKADLDLRVGQMEAHYLAGGDVQRVVQAAHGTIRVKSTPHQGATFTIELPVA